MGKDYNELANAFAFLGNSLLAPMTQTESVGLSPKFWEAFPTFDDERVAKATQACAEYACQLLDESVASGRDEVELVSVEYTRLFIGPPRPAAAPWETFYRAAADHEVNVGFGQAAFEMQKLLRQAGLEIRNENNQYADHMGIELLYLSELCRRCALGCAQGQADGAVLATTEFIHSHPGAWVLAFQAKISQAAPNGYFSNLVSLVNALLEMW